MSQRKTTQCSACSYYVGGCARGPIRRGAHCTQGLSQKWTVHEVVPFYGKCQTFNKKASWK